MIKKREHKLMVAEFESALRSTNRDGIEELIKWIQSTDFYIAPARTAHGCAYPGGLLKHSLNVYHLLLHKLSPRPGSVWKGISTDPDISSDSIVIVSLLHDLCKTGLFRVEKFNKKTYDPEKIKKANSWDVKKDRDGLFVWESVPGYKIDEKIPLGYGEKSVILALKYIRLTDSEIYAIRWHRGALDTDSNREIGDVFANVPLALALYEADLEATFILDAQ